ncbi:MAG: RdgB/HAM1 family non-canonical purine NTP pyrophosphatase [Planctomycetaceae bacterium]
MNTRTIILGTGNAKKAGEVADLLSPHGWTVKTLADFDTRPTIVEDADSFAGNAAIKAIETAKHYNAFGMGEDSGLVVDALDGAPGIYSARYSGENATDESNNAKLIEALGDVPIESRGAGYVCSVAVSDPDGNIVLAVEGTCRGRIGFEPKGANGFGYDPYFVLREYHRTFGELGSVVKRKLSHRARAFAKLIPQLQRYGAAFTGESA